MRPVVRVGVRRDLEARALELRDGVRRWHLDPVDLAAAQSGEACRWLGQRQQHELVDLRPPLGVPVLLVRLQLQALARHEPRHAEGAGARGLLGELAPVLEFLPLRRRHDDHVADLIGHEARRLVGLELDRVVVDLRDAGERGEAKAHLPGAVRVEVRRVLLLDGLVGEDDGVGVEGTAIVERDTTAELEHPLRRRVLAHFPRLRESGYQGRQPIAAAQIPRDQRLVDLVADESEPLEAVVGLAARVGNVAGCHADAQRALCTRGAGGQEREDGGEEQDHDASHDEPP